MEGDTTTDDVYIVSPSYLIERDERDMELLNTIEKNNIK